MESVICFVCSEQTSDFYQNFNELYTSHSKAGLNVLLRRILKDSILQRNIHFRLNCICKQCFADIDEYDKLCVEILEKESQLRNRLLVTDTLIRSKRQKNLLNELEMDPITVEIDDDSDENDQETSTAEHLQATLPSEQKNTCEILDSLIKQVLDEKLKSSERCLECNKQFQSKKKFKVRQMMWKLLTVN